MSTATRTLRRFGGDFRTGIVYVWDHPIIMSAILLVAAVFLFNVIVKQTFKPYTNCNYLLVTSLHMDSFFCNGYTVKWFGETIFKIPGLRGVMDPPLEFVRAIIAWSVLIFFAFVSMFLTIVINRIASIIKILTLNREEWRRFLGSIRTWLLLFVTFGAIFYFSVIR